MGTTDTGGYFAFSGLPGGVYQIATREGLGTYRAWTPGAAPTSAQPGALLIDGNEVVRGAGQTLRFYLSNPWVLGVIAAGSMGTATALILDNQHPHSP